MPDGFVGTLEDGKRVNIETLNAIYFDVRTKDGKPLILAPGKNIELSIKVD